MVGAAMVSFGKGIGRLEIYWVTESPWWASRPPSIGFAMPEKADHVGQSVAGAFQNRVNHINDPSYKCLSRRLRAPAFHPARSSSSLTLILTLPAAASRNRVTMSEVQVDNRQQSVVERKQMSSDSSSVLKGTTADEVEKGATQEDVEETKGHSWTSYERLRPFILVGLAVLILGWWISSIVLPATRHRWFVFQIFELEITFFASTFVDPPSSPGSFKRFGPGSLFCKQNLFYRHFCEPHLFVKSARLNYRFSRVIAFRFIPNSVVSKPVAAVWGPVVAKPFGRLPRHVKLGLGWLALLAIVFGSAFGFPLPGVSPYFT